MNNIQLISFLNKVQTKFPNLSWWLASAENNEVSELYAYIDWGLEEDEYFNSITIVIQKLSEKVKLDIDTEPYDTIVTVRCVSELHKSSVDIKEWRSCDEDYVLDCLYKWLQSLSTELNKVV